VATTTKAKNAPLPRRDLRRQNRLGSELRAAGDLDAIVRKRHGDPGEIAGKVIDRTATLWVYVGSQVDKLIPGVGKNTSEINREYMTSYDANGNAVIGVNYLIAREDTLRGELFGYVSRAAQLGIADRAVRVREAQMSLIGHAMKEACHEIGLSQDQQALLAQALQKSLQRALPVGT